MANLVYSWYDSKNPNSIEEYAQRLIGYTFQDIEDLYYSTHHKLSESEDYYSVEWRVINAAEYGAAQRRRRIFIFAYKNNTKFYSIQSPRSADSIIISDGFFATTFPVNAEGDISSTTIKYSDVHSISDNFAFPFENSGYMTCGKIYTAKTAPIIEEATPLRQLLEISVAKKYYLGANIQKWEYLKGAKRIERTSEAGHKYIFSEGPIAFPDSLDMPARTMLTSESSLNRSTHVIRDPETEKLRLITPLSRTYPRV